MKIETLVQDIYNLVDKGSEVSDELVNAFATELAGIVKDRLGERPMPRLRLSNLGTKCDRKLWLEVNYPETAEPLSPDTRLKFLIGDIHEAVLLFLAQAAGHKVEGAQDQVRVEGILGHRDAVIDGVLVDVKSTSSRSFTRFEAGLSPENDSFGYLYQLGSYLAGAQDDPIVTDKSRAAFLASDKTLGKLALDMHSAPEDLPDAEEVYRMAKHKKEMLASDEMPPRGYEDEPDGKSGNRKLGLACSYCAVKHACWPNLQVYVYASGPRFLTKVAREPKVGRDDGPF